MQRIAFTAFCFFLPSMAIHAAPSNSCVIDPPLVEIRAKLSADSRFANKANEISGIALAGFFDKDDQPVLWAHEENKPNLLLLLKPVKLMSDSNPNAIG